jgi:hypothetical protein
VQDAGIDAAPIILTTAVHEDEKLQVLATDKMTEVAMYVEAMIEAEKAS